MVNIKNYKTFFLTKSLSGFEVKICLLNIKNQTH